jgi:hypothetical protein
MQTRRASDTRAPTCRSRAGHHVDFAGHYGVVPASPDVPEERPSNHRGKEWLRETFQIDPPRDPREALSRFVISLVVVTPAGFCIALLFDVLGWSPTYGAVVGIGLGLSIAARHIDSMGENGRLAGKSLAVERAMVGSRSRDRRAEVRTLPSALALVWRNPASPGNRQTRGSVITLSGVRSPHHKGGFVRRPPVLLRPCPQPVAQPARL